jgi:serine/threonine protein kinase
MTRGQRQRSFQPVSFGKYLLLEKIGSGGMAEIYRAKTFGAHGFEREYAVKKILPNRLDDREFIEMFVDEARLAAQLHHSNIVQVYDLGDVGNQCYIAMECVHGKDLLALLARCDSLNVKLPLKLVFLVVTEVLKGLDFAHKAKDRKGERLNLVHRDVSPCNVLLSYHGEVKLGDFGVAKASVQRNRTEAGMLKGKIGYMSPEQIGGERIDHRSDLFAAGVLLFELLTMRRLFTGQSDLEVMLKIRDGKLEEDLKDLHFLPEVIQRVAIKALAQNRQDRYQSAGEMLQDLIDVAYKYDIRFFEDDLGRFMRRAFAVELREWRDARSQDPGDASAFPDLESPQVARYRFREPNGAIVGPMPLETLLSILKHRFDEAGCTLSVDGGAWVTPSQEEEVVQRLQALRAEEVGLMRPAGRLRLSTQHRRARAHEPSRVFGPEELKDGREGLGGSLVDASFPQLLYELFSLKANGVLTVTLGEVHKSVSFEAGAPCYVASNKSNELLGNFLCDQGILNHAQLQLALERLSEFGGRLGDVLVDERLVPEVELFHYLSLQARQKLLDVFTWEKGDFVYDSTITPRAERYPLGINTLEILVQGVRTRTPLGLIRAHLAQYEGRPMRRLSRSAVDLRELGLTARELSLATSLRDGQTLQDALKQAERGREEELWRLLFLLRCTQFLTFEGAREAQVLVQGLP